MRRKRRSHGAVRLISSAYIPGLARLGMTGKAMGRLDGRVAIVTGAGSETGIGSAIARLFASEGAAVTVADIDEPGGRGVVDGIHQAGGHSIFSRCDVSNVRSVEAMLYDTLRHFGALHILVNNAAITREANPALETTEDEWDRSLNVGLKGAFLCSKSAIPKMIEAGSGSIVNIASVGGLVGFQGYAAYCSAKGGLLQLTKSLAIDYGRHNIRANAICPGPIRTGISPHEDDPHYRYQIAMTVLGRTGRPEEVASAALFLASEESSYITASILTVDGGWTAR